MSRPEVRDWRQAEVYRARCRTALTEARRAASHGDAEAAGRHLQDALTWRRLARPSSVRSPGDALLGMAWYNGLSKAQRAYWHMLARSAVPADAWEEFKAREVRA